MRKTIDFGKIAYNGKRKINSVDLEVELRETDKGPEFSVCGKHFEYSEMEADHITPWWRGGLTVLDNCQMLCAKCNEEKAGRPAQA